MAQLIASNIGSNNLKGRNTFCDATVEGERNITSNGVRITGRSRTSGHRLSAKGDLRAVYSLTQLYSSERTR